ncbi:MAG: CDP-alcohol phosphatidyltransferase family protein [Candidatus Thorarchaeota archaeon]
MIDNWISKLKFKKSYEKFVEKLVSKTFSANQLTIIGLIFGLLAAFTIFMSGIFVDFSLFLICVSAILMTISFFIDTLDGPIARLKGPTVFGGILDIFCDRTVEISIIIAIVSTDTINLIYPGLFSLASIILCISMFLLVGSLSERHNDANKSKVIKYRKGLIERSETYLFLLAITILFFWRVLLLWIFTILIFITALLRLRDAYILFQN